MSSTSNFALRGTNMTYHGTVQNGIVVLDNGVTLPDGTPVTVVPVAASSQKSQSASPSPQLTIGQKLAELGRWAETQSNELPEDLAENHDHYLHGVTKRS